MARDQYYSLHLQELRKIRSSRCVERVLSYINKLYRDPRLSLSANLINVSESCFRLIRSVQSVLVRVPYLCYFRTIDILRIAKRNPVSRKLWYALSFSFSIFLFLPPLVIFQITDYRSIRVIAYNIDDQSSICRSLLSLVLSLCKCGETFHRVLEPVCLTLPIYKIRRCGLSHGCVCRPRKRQFQALQSNRPIDSNRRAK